MRCAGEWQWWQWSPVRCCLLSIVYYLNEVIINGICLDYLRGDTDIVGRNANALSLFLIPHLCTPVTLYYKTFRRLSRDGEIGDRQRQQKSIPACSNFNVVHFVFNVLFSPWVLFRPMAEPSSGKQCVFENHILKSGTELHDYFCGCFWPAQIRRNIMDRAEELRMGTNAHLIHVDLQLPL